MKDYIEVLEKIADYFSSSVSSNGVRFRPEGDTLCWTCVHCGGEGLEYTRNIKHSEDCIVLLFKQARLLKGK